MATHTVLGRLAKVCGSLCCFVDFTMRWWTVGFALMVFACPRAAVADGPPETPFGWTGLYVGVNGGYSWGKVTNHLKMSSTSGSTFAASATADLDGPVGG